MKTLSEIRVLLIEFKDGWSAQALEIDIAAQAKTLNDLRYEFQRVLMSYVVLDHEEGVFDKLGPAPKEYFDMWEASDIEVHSKDIIKSDDLKMPKRNVRVAELHAA